MHLFYTAIEAIFNIPTITYGAWTGISLHEIAQVVLAAGIGRVGGNDICFTWKIRPCVFTYSY
ncbi:putative sulfate exporter family transporter [Dermacoccus sp. Ellin185]|uniref:putative sulfate exporter family transporter n=1 Tax=Dermacoccus sp. Ellin185 TaxID=188626 RepID=UPI0035291763